MKIAVLAGAVTAALMMSTAQGAVRIKSDPGGQIGPYLENLVALRGSDFTRRGIPAKTATRCRARRPPSF